VFYIYVVMLVWVYLVDLEEAVEKAIQFLERKAGYLLHRLRKADFRKEEGKWYLEFDVGILSEKIVKIVIDDRDGRIIYYEGPTGGS